VPGGTIITAIVLIALTIASVLVMDWFVRGWRELLASDASEQRVYGDVVELPPAARKAGGRPSERGGQQRTGHVRTHDGGAT
jgi:hypothetical protein